MTNTFLILTDAYGDIIRIRADSISDYKANGHFTTLTVNGNSINVLHKAEDIDKALTESYFMLKPVVHEESN